MPATKKVKVQDNAAGPSKTVKGKPVVQPPSSDTDEVDVEDGESDTEDNSDDDGGVDTEGMERLMNALGKDGLDDYEKMQLHALGGGEDEDDSEDDENFEPGDNASGSGDEEANYEDAEGSEGGEEDVDEQDIAWEDVESVDDDAVPRQKIEIDNTVALARIRDTIQLDPTLPWTETLVLTYPDAIDVNVNDDLNRELAFYKQALHGANAGRALAVKHKFAFTRPADYFAEMIKSDAHMERIRQRLLDERAGIKKSEDKRKEREGKKFGKQVQIEKLKERERSKKEMEERLKGLKRKRGDMLDKPTDDPEGFDIAVEDAISDRPAKRGRGGARGGSKVSRQSRDQKYGFGGAGKHSKSNTRESTDDFGGGKRGRGGMRGGHGGGRGGFGGRGGGGRGGGKRLGKSRRADSRSRK